MSNTTEDATMAEIEAQVRASLADGWDPMELDERGRNALQQWLSPDIAVEEGITQGMVEAGCRVLLEQGLDPNACNREGYWPVPSPLFMAVEQKNMGVAKLLLEHGADPNRTEFDEASGRSNPRSNPLAKASALADKDMCLLLLEHGADPNPPAYNHDDGFHLSTPLMAAAARGHVDVCLLLLERGADPCESRPLYFYGPTPNPAKRESQGYQGGDEHMAEVELLTQTASPLFFAAMNGHQEVSRLLLEHGADASTQVSVSIMNHPEDGPDGIWKETPAQTAERSGHPLVAGTIQAFLKQKDLERVLGHAPRKADGPQMVIGGQIWSAREEAHKDSQTAALEAPRQRMRL